MKILVTGAAGFIGYFTSKRLLELGHDVVLADNFSRHGAGAVLDQISDKNATFIELDLMREESWTKIGRDFDVVYHYAAINGTRNFYDMPFQVLRTNSGLITSLLSWHERENPQAHIIWTSSSEVYAGVSGINIPTAELKNVGVGDIYNPRNTYAISKIFGESLLINYCRNKTSSYTIIRPHNVFGPRMGFDHVIPEFAMRIIKGENPFKIYGAHQTRSYCYIEDFVDGAVAIPGNHSAFNKILNLGDDRHEISSIELANLMLDICDVERDFVFFPPPDGSVNRRCPDITLARETLGYMPSSAIENSLKKTIEWYKDDYESL